MTCVKLMKIHDFSLSGLLELKSSEKGEYKEFYLILLILESFPFLVIPRFSSVLFSRLITKIKKKLKISGML